MFTNVDNEVDQFSYLSNICIVLGGFSCLAFATIINEVKLVKASKEKFDEYFMIENDTINSDGVLLDADDSQWNVALPG